MGDFDSFFKKNKWTIIFVAAGLLFLVMSFTIGFWRTLLTIIIIGALFFIGKLMDEGGFMRVKEFFRSLFKKE